MHFRLTLAGRRVRNTLLKGFFGTTCAILVLRGCIDALFDPGRQNAPQAAAVAPQPAQSVWRSFDPPNGLMPSPQPRPVPASPWTPPPVRSYAPQMPVYQPPPDPPLLVDIRVSRAVARIGDSITWTARPRGGNGYYSYSWSGTDGLSGTDADVTTSYQTPGGKSAAVTVISGNQSSHLMIFTMIEAPPPPPVRFGPPPGAAPSNDDPATPPAIGNNVPSWATHRLVSTTGWERSYQDAQAASWRALRQSVMSLPLGNGETIADSARRDPQLGDRITRAISTLARVIKVQYGSGGVAQLQMELPLQEISRIVKGK